MRLNELKEVLRAQPFEPFRIKLTNEDSYVIRHPEFAALSRSSVHVGIPSGKDGIPDRYVQCDLLHVVSIEPVNGRTPGARRTPRKR